MRGRILTSIAAACILLLWSVPALAATDDNTAAGQQEIQRIEIQGSGEEQWIDIEDILPDSEELFEGYANQKLYPQTQGGPRKAKAKDRRSTLSETDQIVYDLLKEKISQVADGKLEDTSFDIPIKEIFGEDILKEFTAQDLGVSAIVVNNSIAGDASAKLREKIEIHFSDILHSLMADCPYEFYWYDKTANTLSGGPAVSAVYWDGGGYLFFQKDAVYSFFFPVAKAYSQDDVTGTYQAATAETSKVTTAVNTAKEIVNTHSAKDDYSKLDAYREDICSLVSYNHDAANNNDTPYGNPWQLIWVFDKDPTTNVVCEGYAKAFQYLCDLSTFDYAGVECHTVTGTMNGGTGAGGHMWNIVTMDDGKNYLVDITNCDTGTIGAPKSLFVAVPANGTVSEGYTFKAGTGNASSIAYVYDEDTHSLFQDDILTLSGVSYNPHTHIWDAGAVQKEATCTDKGFRVYTCTICGGTRTEEIPAKGHTEMTLPAREATCTESGWTEGKKCSVCEAILEEQKEIPALGHHWDAGQITKKATCTEAGKKTYTCTTCGATKTENLKALGHNYSKKVTSPTCTKKGYTQFTCTRCGDSYTGDYTAAAGHKWDAGRVKKTASCTQKGESIYTCKTCGVTKTVSIPINLKNHIGQAVVKGAKPATVERKGYTGDTYCSSCGRQIKRGTEVARVINPATPDAQQKGKEITKQTNDNDPKGSVYHLLQTQAKNVNNNSIKVTWKKVKGANGYIIYGNLCGKGKRFVKLGATTATSYTQKKLKKGTYYKYLVLAYKNVDGGQIILSTSKVIHAATAGGKVGNWKSIKLNKNKISLKKGKTYTLKTTQVAASKKLKVKKHRKIAFETSNSHVATVTAGGKIKAVGKGKCTIFVYAQNGICSKATVVVN